MSASSPLFEPGFAEMGHDLFVLWLSALPVICSPGPANLSLAGVGVSYGIVRSLPYLAGILLGTAGVLLMVASGLTVLVVSAPVLAHLLTLLGSAYLIYVAWKIASAPAGNLSKFQSNAPSMLSGIVLALANPKAFAAIGAVYLGQQPYGDPTYAVAPLKFLVLSSLIIISGASWLAMGTIFSNFLQQPRVGRIANVSFAAMLILSVAYSYVGW